eukprot:GABW01003700.1.p1 GENE.GABW01003700.1~~GABW01003700.1.p1  ORF type:complete len:71 (-),score=10.34 GABW01003700.1:3-215(-)
MQVTNAGVHTSTPYLWKDFGYDFEGLFVDETIEDGLFHLEAFAGPAMVMKQSTDICGALPGLECPIPHST